MAKKFVMLLLSAESQVVTLDVAAKILTEEDPIKIIKNMARNSKCVRSYMEKGSCEPKHFPKIRRLYDIANVLASLKLIIKEKQMENGLKKTVYRWISFHPEELSQDAEFLFSQSPAPRIGYDDRNSQNYFLSGPIGQYDLSEPEKTEQQKSVAGSCSSGSDFDKYRALLKTPGRKEPILMPKKTILIKNLTHREATVCLLPGSDLKYPEIVLPNNFVLNTREIASPIHSNYNQQNSTMLETNDESAAVLSPFAKKARFENIEDAILKDSSLLSAIGALNAEALKQVGSWKEAMYRFPSFLPANGHAFIMRSLSGSSNSQETGGHNAEELLIPFDSQLQGDEHVLNDLERDTAVLNAVNNFTNSEEDYKDLKQYVTSVNTNSGFVNPLMSLPLTIPTTSSSLARPIGITWAPEETLLSLDQMYVDSEWSEGNSMCAPGHPSNLSAMAPQYLIPPLNYFVQQSDLSFQDESSNVSSGFNPAIYSQSSNGQSFHDLSSSPYCNPHAVSSASCAPMTPYESQIESPSCSSYHERPESAINLSQHSTSAYNNPYFLKQMPVDFSQNLFGFGSAVLDPSQYELSGALDVSKVPVQNVATDYQCSTVGIGDNLMLSNILSNSQSNLSFNQNVYNFQSGDCNDICSDVQLNPGDLAVQDGSQLGLLHEGVLPESRMDM